MQEMGGGEMQSSRYVNEQIENGFLLGFRLTMANLTCTERENLEIDHRDKTPTRTLEISLGKKP